MFISQAFAQNAQVVPVVPGDVAETSVVQGPVAGASVPANTPDPVMANVMLIGMLLMIFYMLVWRPQQQRMKKHKEMMDNLRKGDVVVTAGGLIATVTKIVADDEVEVQLADGVKVRAVKNTIVNVLVPTGEKSVTQKDAKPETSADDGAKESKKNRKKGAGSEKIAPQVAKPKGAKSDANIGPTLSVVPATSSEASAEIPASDNAAKTAVNS